jgi:hypothetical protein
MKKTWDYTFKTNIEVAKHGIKSKTYSKNGKSKNSDLQNCTDENETRIIHKLC